MPSREEMDQIIDESKEALIDDFADLCKMLNGRNYERAAIYMYNMAKSMEVIAAGIAAEALARRLEARPLDKPDDF